MTPSASHPPTRPSQFRFHPEPPPKYQTNFPLLGNDFSSSDRAQFLLRLALFILASFLVTQLFGFPILFIFFRLRGGRVAKGQLLQQRLDGAGVNVAIGSGSGSVIVVTIFTYFINPGRLLICALNLRKCGNIWLGLWVGFYPTIDDNAASLLLLNLLLSIYQIGFSNGIFGFLALRFNCSSLFLRLKRLKVGQTSCGYYLAGSWVA